MLPAQCEIIHVKTVDEIKVCKHAKRGLEISELLKVSFRKKYHFPFCSPPSTCPSLVSWSHRIGMNGAAAWQRSALFVWKHQNKCPVKLFSYEPWKFDGLIKRGDGVVGENLQSNLPTILSEGLFKLDFFGTIQNYLHTSPPPVVWPWRRRQSHTSSRWRSPCRRRWRRPPGSSHHWRWSASWRCPPF